MNKPITVTHGYPLGSLQCLSAASNFDGRCRASRAQVGAATEPIRPEDVNVYGPTLEAMGNFVGTHSG
jgi:hypothetical protein